MKTILSPKVLSLAAIVVGVFVYVYVSHSVSASTFETDVISCDRAPEESRKIDCWMRLIEHQFVDGGTKEAFAAFLYIYERYDAFATTGCHKHAHRVGDLSFYYDYLKHEDFSKMNFPKNASTCGYGFYHGFFEHLFQNHPDPGYIKEICDIASVQLKEAAPAIDQTCIHGAGHGITLAVADQYVRPEDWTIENFTKKPLAVCEQLDTTDEYRKECYLGVFTILTEWMSDESYGLSYNTADPYWHCNQVVDRDQQYGCYMEVSQKFDSLSGFDIKKVVELVDSGTRPDLRNQIIGLVLAGFIQSNPMGDKFEHLYNCKDALGPDSDLCVQTIVGGTIEHTPAGARHEAVDSFCSDSRLDSHDRDVCYSHYARKILRFDPLPELKERCEAGSLPGALCEKF